MHALQSFDRSTIKTLDLPPKDVQKYVYMDPKCMLQSIQLKKGKTKVEDEPANSVLSSTMTCKFKVGFSGIRTNAHNLKTPNSCTLVIFQNYHQHTRSTTKRHPKKSICSPFNHQLKALKINYLRNIQSFSFFM